MKISRFDYKKQKELLESYIGEDIIYKGEVYKIEEISSGTIQMKGEDYSTDTTWNVCLLSRNNEIINPHIDEIFKICYPHFCWLEN